MVVSPLRRVALTAAVLFASGCSNASSVSSGYVSVDATIANPFDGLGAPSDTAGVSEDAGSSGPDGAVAPQCGNGVCDPGETATACPADCKASQPGCTTYAEVKPILAGKCGQCHSFAGGCTAMDKTSGTSATGMGGIPPNMPPKGEPMLTMAEKAKLSEWFSNGSPCDTKACPLTGPVCGNGQCETGETTASCVQDCPAPGPVCGNGKCETGETTASCVQDCPAPGPVCGNGKCETGENTASCAQDCPAPGPVCGNGKCETGETTASCAQDCPAPGPVCGNGKCEAGETAANCAKDCTLPPPANYCDSHCTTDKQPAGCYCDDQCNQYGDCCMADGSMPKQKNVTCAGTCGLCNGGGTTTGPVCGNGTCETGETTANCAKDCPATSPVCGNGKCETGETTTSCAKDCPGGTTACKTTYASVQQILMNNCNGCHGHKFGSGCSIAKYSASSIKSKVSSGSMPPGGFSSSVDKQAVLKWISDGSNCTIPGCP